MALTKIGKEGITGVSNAANATFLTATSAEGVTLAGTLAVTGVHTVGTNAVATSDGGATTTSIVQGLIKCFMDLDGTGTISLNDSFNISSVADNATGTYTPSYSSNFGNLFYGWGGNAEHPNSGHNGRAPHQFSDSVATSSTKIGAGYQLTVEDCEHVRAGWWGDLA